MNSIHFIGRLTKDPELSYGQKSKIPYCNFSIAIDRGTNKDGIRAGADFPMLTSFGKVAENMDKYLEKGCMLAIEGHFRSDTFERNGHTEYTSRIIADKVKFLDWKKKTHSMDEHPVEVIESTELEENELEESVPDNSELGPSS